MAFTQIFLDSQLGRLLVAVIQDLKKICPEIIKVGNFIRTYAVTDILYFVEACRVATKAG